MAATKANTADGPSTLAFEGVSHIQGSQRVYPEVPASWGPTLWKGVLRKLRQRGEWGARYGEYCIHY